MGGEHQVAQLPPQKRMRWADQAREFHEALERRLWQLLAEELAEGVVPEPQMRTTKAVQQEAVFPEEHER